MVVDAEAANVVGFQRNMNLTLQRAVHGLSDMASLLTKDPVVLTRAAEGAPQAG